MLPSHWLVMCCLPDADVMTLGFAENFSRDMVPLPLPSSPAVLFRSTMFVRDGDPPSTIQLCLCSHVLCVREKVTSELLHLFMVHSFLPSSFDETLVEYFLHAPRASALSHPPFLSRPSPPLPSLFTPLLTLS